LAKKGQAKIQTQGLSSLNLTRKRTEI